MVSKVQYIGNKKIIKPGQSTNGALIAYLVLFLLSALFFYKLGANSGRPDLLPIMNGVIVIFGIMYLVISLFTIYYAGYTVELEGEKLTQVYRVFGKIVYQRTLSLKNGYRFKSVYTQRGGQLIYLVIDGESVLIAISGLDDDHNTDKVLLSAMLGKDELTTDAPPRSEEIHLGFTPHLEFTPKNVLKAIGKYIVFGIVCVILVVLTTIFLLRISGL